MRVAGAGVEAKVRGETKVLLGQFLVHFLDTFATVRSAHDLVPVMRP